MKRAMTIVTMAALWGGLASYGLAQDSPAPQPAVANNAEVRTEAAPPANLRAEIHRTLAALIEAQAAETPDQARIDELTQNLQQLRAKLYSQNVAAAVAPAGWACPWGGPGLGRGYGAGWGRGRGAGMGPGGGYGRGAMSGYGRGLGPGAGQGLAPEGLAPGGPAFVDRNGNGVCDYYELRRGMRP